MKSYVNNVLILYNFTSTINFIRKNFVCQQSSECDNNCPQVKNNLKLSILNINLSMAVGKAHHTYKGFVV